MNCQGEKQEVGMVGSNTFARRGLSLKVHFSFFLSFLSCLLFLIKLLKIPDSLWPVISHGNDAVGRVGVILL